ncbi:hypothetical protein M8818_003005 [Zalaria obscura]|uniref:Uncharacterized protein n=1 Tax=Zalaria obscura TaxID=2024903 RepID=A0ACC3SFM9_9PEZI
MVSSTAELFHPGRCVRPAQRPDSSRTRPQFLHFHTRTRPQQENARRCYDQLRSICVSLFGVRPCSTERPGGCGIVVHTHVTMNANGKSILQSHV